MGVVFIRHAPAAHLITPSATSSVMTEMAAAITAASSVQRLTLSRSSCDEAFDDR